MPEWSYLPLSKYQEWKAEEAARGKEAEARMVLGWARALIRGTYAEGEPTPRTLILIYRIKTRLRRIRKELGLEKAE